MILHPDGYIVTNNHVVENARKIEVKLPRAGRRADPGMTLPAKVVGVDRETDLAVLKIEGRTWRRSSWPIPAGSDKVSW